MSQKPTILKLLQKIFKLSDKANVEALKTKKYDTTDVFQKNKIK